MDARPSLPPLLRSTSTKGGRDPDFQRDPETLVPSRLRRTTPSPCTLAARTRKAPIKNAKSQVINVHGSLSPGCGEPSLFAFAYQGGGNIAELIIFARSGKRRVEPPLDSVSTA